MTPMQIIRARLLMRSPFYGTLLMMTPLVESRDYPVAATDMVRIYWNPDVFARMSVDEGMFVLAHEVMHIVLLHGMRQGAREAIKWNDACDYAINPILVLNKFSMPKPPNHGLIDKKYVGKSAEEIYLLLPKRPPTAPRGNLSGDLKAPPKGAQPAAVRGRVAQAVTAARMAGKLPAGMDQIIQDILYPQVPWQELLRHYMTLRSNTRQDWSKRNRRFPDVYLPTRTGRRMGGVGLINDTSGSVDQKIRDAFAAEARCIADETGADRVIVKHADTKTQAEQVFTRGEPIVLRPRGGGGTDMRVPLREFEDMRENIECVIMLTDGLTPWPIVEPSVPLIVCCTTKAAIPVGNVVRITV